MSKEEIKPGTLHHLEEKKFLSNNQITRIFKFIEDMGYVRDRDMMKVHYLQEGDVVEVIKSKGRGSPRELCLRTVAGRRMPLTWVEVRPVIEMTGGNDLGTVEDSFEWVPKPPPADVFAKHSDFSKVLQPDVRENQNVHCVRLTGDRGDTYDAVYNDMAAYQNVRDYMDGRFLKAAYSVIDKQGMIHPGDKVDVLVTEVGGENLITFVLHDGATNHYRISENSIRCVPVITVLEFKTTGTTHMFSVIMTTPFNSNLPQTPATLGGNVLDSREEYKPQDASHSWIPQINQFVKVVGRTEMWVIHDYDDYTNEFIIKLADRTRAKRAETLVRRGSEVEPTTDMAVKGSCLRPVVLKY